MICINLLRVSPDSKYLEFSIEAPTDYVFNKLYIKRYDGTGDYEGWKDCSNLLQGTTNKEIMRINTSAFGGTSIFYVEFGVKWNGTGDEPTDGCSPLLSSTTTVGVCSDINLVYANLLDMILKINGCCVDASVYDDLTRNHMFLYAHTEAMRLQRYSEAEYFYDILKNLFTNCGPISRQSGITTKSCNCG